MIFQINNYKQNYTCPSFYALMLNDKDNKNLSGKDLNEKLKKYADLDLKDYDTYQKEKDKIEQEESEELKLVKQKKFVWNRKEKLDTTEEKYRNIKEGFKRGLTSFLLKIDLHLQDLKLLELTTKAKDDAINELIEIKKTAASLYRAREIAEQQAQNKNGLNSIAGYQKEKDILHEVFIDMVTAERTRLIDSSELPNGILLFGPTGCGKTKMVHSIAEDIYGNEKDKYFYDIDVSKDPADIIQDIDNAMQESLKNFIESNIRSIILINEAEAIANNEDEVTAESIKAIIGTANDYYCTFFLTTNFPSEIEPGVIGKNKVKYQIPINPPNSQNMKEVLKFYFDRLDVKNLDYDELVKELCVEAFKKKGKYSNSGIEDMYKKCRSIKGLSQEKIKELIKSMPINITNEELSEYKRDIINFGGEKQSD